MEAVEQLSQDEQAVYWEVKEWFPRAASAAVIANIEKGLEELISLCESGTIPQTDEEAASTEDEDLAQAIRMSLQQQPTQPSDDDGVYVGTARQIGQSAALAGLTAARQPAVLAAAVAPAAVASATLKPIAATAAVAKKECAICRQSTMPTARCHFPSERAAGGGGGGDEEDPRAHDCCAKCITSRYMLQRIQVTSRVAISCLRKACPREIHQDRLVADAQLKPVMVQWMLGFTMVTVGEARHEQTVKELKRKREEEPEITNEERERLTIIIDHMDHDKFTYLADLLPDVDFTWLLEHIDAGPVTAILDAKEHAGPDTVPKRKRRRLDKAGVTHLVEERLRMETAFECGICFEEAAVALGVPCVETGGGGGGGAAAGDAQRVQHLFCGACVRGHAAAAASQASIVRAGLGLKCMQPGCAGVLIYAHIEPLLEGRERDQLEERIAAEALAAAAVNVERCQRCPFAAIVDASVAEQPTFGCARCKFEYCRNCNREWTARHEGKSCEELNPEFIRRKVENALSDGAMGVLQRCPQCKVAIEKNGGCNNMHCPCGYTFPYAGVRLMTPQQRAGIIQQAVAEADGDDAAVAAIRNLQ